MKIDTNSIAHTTWNCKYHIVFAPKYRRQVIYGKIKGDIGQIIRKLCEWKGVEIIESEACPDHIHMLVSIPPKISVSSFMGYLLSYPTKDIIKNALARAKHYLQNRFEFSRYERIFAPSFADLPRDEIRSSGYVVDTLEAALWCVLNTDSYQECVLKAVNLGRDTDTVAAVAGGLAGALYGYDAIPEEWRKALQRRDYIEEMCKKASCAWISKTAKNA